MRKDDPLLSSDPDSRFPGHSCHGSTDLSSRVIETLQLQMTTPYHPAPFDLAYEKLRTDTTIRTLVIKILEGAIGEIEEIVRHNTTLTFLHVKLPGFSASDIEILKDALIANTTLKSLSLKGGNIGAQGLSHLGEVLARNHTLTELIINSAKVGKAGIKGLFSDPNCVLQHLRFESAALDSSAIGALTEIVQSNSFSSLVTLDLGTKSTVSQEGLQNLITAVRHNEYITEFHCCYGEHTLTEIDVPMWQDLMLHKTNLSKLGLYANSLIGSLEKASPISPLASVLSNLPHAPYIKELFLQFHHLGEVILDLIADILPRASSLKTLQIVGCGEVETLTAKKFATALTANSSLTSLSLPDSVFVSDAMDHVASIVSGAQSLQTLKLGRIGKGGWERMSDALCTNTSLKIFGCLTPIETPEELGYIAKIMQANHSLTEILVLIALQSTEGADLMDSVEAFRIAVSANYTIQIVGIQDQNTPWQPTLDENKMLAWLIEGAAGYTESAMQYKAGVPIPCFAARKLDLLFAPHVANYVAEKLGEDTYRYMLAHKAKIYGLWKASNPAISGINVNADVWNVIFSFVDYDFMTSPNEQVIMSEVGACEDHG